MMFKSWRDYFIFIRDYAKYSCLNCKYCGIDVDVDDETNTDTSYAQHFCAYHVAMVRWDLQSFLCQYWINKENDEPLPEDDTLFDLSEHIWKKLDKGDKKWSIEEIKELL